MNLDLESYKKVGGKCAHSHPLSFLRDYRRIPVTTRLWHYLPPLERGLLEAPPPPPPLRLLPELLPELLGLGDELRDGLGLRS